MGHVRRPQQVKLVVGLLANDKGLFPKVKRALESRFGKIDFESDYLDFTHTGYYEEEMGKALKRKFLAFSKLRGLEDIYKIKLRTNALEKRFTKSDHRSVNIDPGYLNLAKLVLFSTKDYSHRVYLKSGIYAEVTLHYKDGSFQPWPWTYPDYKSEKYIEIFNCLREVYKGSL